MKTLGAASENSGDVLKILGGTSENSGEVTKTLGAASEDNSETELLNMTRVIGGESQKSEEIEEPPQIENPITSINKEPQSYTAEFGQDSIIAPVLPVEQENEDDPYGDDEFEVRCGIQFLFKGIVHLL